MYVYAKSERGLERIAEGTEGPAGYLDGIRNDLDEMAEYIESNIIPRCATMSYFYMTRVEAVKECGKWSHSTHIWGTAGQFAKYIAGLGEAGERYVDIYSRYVSDILRGAVRNIVRGNGRLPELTVADCDSYETWSRKHSNELSTVGTPGEQVLLGKLAETDNQVVLIGGGSDRST